MTHPRPSPRPLPRQSLSARFRARYLDVLSSVYLYNEHRGYSSLDRVLDAARVCCADDPAFIRDIEQHRADERAHYVMFKRYFERRGVMPLTVDRTVGHIDRFIERVFGCTIDELDTDHVIATPSEFAKLCRIITLTEQRGLRQVEILLNNRIVRGDPVLTKIFRIIERDEPRHFLPYRAWLDRHGKARATWRERWADYWIHKSLMFVKLPAIFLNRRTPRDTLWRDALEAA